MTRTCSNLWQARRRLLVRAVVFVWLVVFGTLHVAQVAIPDRPGSVAWDARMQLRWLEGSLADQDARLAGLTFPEGELFTWEFYGLALQNVAETTRDPDDVARAVRIVRELLPRIDAALANPPYARMARDEVRGGICWFAGQNLLRGRLLALDPHADPADVERFHQDSATLARAFARSASGVLAAHPGMTWPVDSLFGYWSLKIHDELYGTRHFATTWPRFRETMRRGANRTTGLMPSFVYLDGRPRDVPRGCAMSWSIAVLPELDPDFAAEQWTAYRGAFARCAGGLCLFREYPTGVDRKIDGDSGPIVAGLGMSASAFGLAAARAAGDMETAEALRRTGELLGMPAISWWGKRYLGGKIALFDVLSVWTRTVPARASERGSSAWTPVLAIAAFWSILALEALRYMQKSLRDRRGAGGRSFVQLLCFIAAVIAIAVHIVWPPFVGALLVIVLGLIGLTSRIAAAITTMLAATWRAASRAAASAGR
ncbi:MAG: hypothetical protein QM820_07600 [Minicystis sp.]